MGCRNDLGGGRESVNEPIRRWESRERREVRAYLHEGLLLSLRCVGRLGGVGTGQGIHEQFFGPGFALVVENYHLVTLSA